MTRSHLYACFDSEIIRFIHGSKGLHWKWMDELGFGLYCHSITHTYWKHKLNSLAVSKLFSLDRRLCLT